MICPLRTPRKGTGASVGVQRSLPGGNVRRRGQSPRRPLALLPAAFGEYQNPRGRLAGSKAGKLASCRFGWSVEVQRQLSGVLTRRCGDSPDGLRPYAGMLSAVSRTPLGAYRGYGKGLGCSNERANVKGLPTSRPIFQSLPRSERPFFRPIPGQAPGWGVLVDKLGGTRA